MRRTVITNLQWWLFILLTGITWWAVPHLGKLAWWWLILGASHYALVLLIFRMRWENSDEASARRWESRHRRYLATEKRRAEADHRDWLREW